MPVGKLAIWRLGQGSGAVSQGFDGEQIDRRGESGGRELQLIQGRGRTHGIYHHESWLRAVERFGEAVSDGYSAEMGNLDRGFRGHFLPIYTHLAVSRENLAWLWGTDG